MNDHLSWLSIGGFSKDSSNMMDDACLSGNAGLIEQSKFAENGKVAKFSTNLFMDIAKQKRLLINGVPINMKFYPGRDEFRLMYEKYSPPGRHIAQEEGQSSSPLTCNNVSQYYTLEIVDASLSLPFVKVHPGLITQYNTVIDFFPFLHYIRLTANTK